MKPTIHTFRHLLEKHSREVKIFETVKTRHSAQGLSMLKGAIVDATLIAGPSSTKNKEGKIVPEITRPRRATSGDKG